MVDPHALADHAREIAHHARRIAEEADALAEDYRFEAETADRLRTLAAQTVNWREYLTLSRMEHRARRRHAAWDLFCLAVWRLLGR